jgi:hypothetical protein
LTTTCRDRCGQCVGHFFHFLVFNSQFSISEAQSLTGRDIVQRVKDRPDGGMFLTYAHNSEVWLKLKYSF